MIRKSVLAGLFSLAMLCLNLTSQAFAEGHRVVVYLFWGDGCPHCHHEKAFLQKLKEKYPTLTVKDHEVWHDPVNKEMYRRMAAAYGLAGGNVPATFIDFQSWIGYDEGKAKEMEEAISRCVQAACLDPEEVMKKAPEPAPVAGTTRTLADMIAAEGIKPPPVPPPAREEPATVQLPLLGAVDPSTVSLPVLTVVLAGLDGFNPCAFFVLLMLLSLMVHAQSRPKMLLVGGVFVFFSGFVYFLFMAAWLNLFLIMGQVNTITTVAGLVAVVIAVINIKDYFWFKQGVSLTISQKAQASLLARMRGLIQTGSLGGMIAGTAVLALLANLYELLCTAGFPMVFTRALTLQHLPPAQYYLYLVFYNVIYVLPLLVIVFMFAATLGSRKLTEQEGRVLKLVSGLMMLGLGCVLVVRPQLLNSVFLSVGLVAGVLIVSSLIVWLTVKKPR